MTLLFLYAKYPDTADSILRRKGNLLEIKNNLLFKI